MMDLDNTTVSNEYAMVCTDLHYEDWDEDIIVYSDQGVSTEEHDEAMYRELTKLKVKKKKKKLTIKWPYTASTYRQHVTTTVVSCLLG